jgi:hypothetical protein
MYVSKGPLRTETSSLVVLTTRGIRGEFGSLTQGYHGIWNHGRHKLSGLLPHNQGILALGAVRPISRNDFFDLGNGVRKDGSTVGNGRNWRGIVDWVFVDFGNGGGIRQLQGVGVVEHIVVDFWLRLLGILGKLLFGPFSMTALPLELALAQRSRMKTRQWGSQ